MIRTFFRARTEFRSMVQSMTSQFDNMFNSATRYNYPQFALAGVENITKGAEEESVFGNWIWFAAPKSKISPSRKRQKHMRFFPEKVAWVTCEKCGEPKRPHRICTDNIDICAMRPEEYAEHLQKEMAAESNKEKKN